MLQGKRLGELYCATGMVLAGTTFVANGALDRYPVLGGQALRYAGSAVIMFAFVRPWRRGFPRPTRRQLLVLAVTAALGMVGLNSLSVLAMRIHK